MTQDLVGYKKFWTLANYMACAQLYLQDNFFMKEALKPEHIKERLLGHWGTCPGINFVYTYCNYLINKYNCDMLLVTGPGHGAPANLSCLWEEGSLERFYPDKYPRNGKGFANLLHAFSWPGGFPSHVEAEVPGSINAGGELGYSLSVSYGAVMDYPDLIVTCIVGDGEAETGPIATAWHSHKWIHPGRDGAVLPILHLNGFKIANKTLFATMSDEQLHSLFSGYGYNMKIVDDMSRIHEQMAETMDWAYQEIRKIQQAARSGNPIFRPIWPMIILRTPKGWTATKEFGGKQIVGHYNSHQVPLADPRKNAGELKALEEWLRSYQIDELLDVNGEPVPEIKAAAAKGDKRMGCNPIFLGRPLPLNLPDYRQFMVEQDLKKSRDGEQVFSATTAGGEYLAALIAQNRDRFRIFSPDELESNKLHKVFKTTTRCYQWDTPDFAKNMGNVLEVLSEHNCQGWMQGYNITGRYSLFPSYEAFMGIIATMMMQFCKFCKLGSEVVWRNPVPSLNYIESSTLWRQEHNGFSHQNPVFINIMINMKSEMTRIYLPPDANTLVSTLDHCCKSVGRINLIIAAKRETPIWLNKEEADKHCCAGASIWKWASTDDGIDPDVVLVGCGVEPTNEVIAAAYLLRKEVPELRVRVVNLTDLMILSETVRHPHGLSSAMFDALFTRDKPVVFNFHGYPSAVKQLIFERPNTDRFQVNGYLDEGTTTTAFHMLSVNRCSRFDLAIQALEATAAANPRVALIAAEKVAHYKHMLSQFNLYIKKYGKDPEELEHIQPPADGYKSLHLI